ncbi:MAG TPA: anti-sigma factor [Gaiellales bacterium]|nr:anti-sigma factor [Gaiellales bacterium]
MSDHDDFDRVEQILRSVPAPTAVPPGLADVAREAALGGAGADRRSVVAVARPRVPRFRFRFARLSAGVAVMAAAAAAALVIGVGGRGSPFDAQTSLALAGPTGASATVDFGAANQGTRPMLVRIHDLRPAKAGWYYEMWFNVRGDEVSAVTFNTSSSGEATVRSAISSDMHWGSCWVTLEKVGGPDPGRVVLRST